MKITATIKNLKNNIIGYFNKELGFNSDMYIFNTSSGTSNVYIGSKDEDTNIKAFPFSYIFLNMQSGSPKNLTFSKYIKNKFRILVVAPGAPCVIIKDENGNTTYLEASTALYEYTPINWDDSEIHNNTIYKKIGRIEPVIGPTSSSYFIATDVYAAFPRNDGA